MCLKKPDRCDYEYTITLPFTQSFLVERDRIRFSIDTLKSFKIGLESEA